MRDDIAETLDEACRPQPRGGAGAFSVDGVRPGPNEKAKRIFLRRLRIFLRELPNDLTLTELRDEMRC